MSSSSLFGGFSAEDALQVWQAIKETVRVNTTRKETAGAGLDYAFVTPTLMALGKFPEQRVDELLHLLQGSPVCVWNLSGKSLSVASKTKLKFQVLDTPWVTPGQFTQAPSLECIFSQCYSIKSWLDLKEEHVAIVHCANGRSRSGILVACLLKYIGAFEHASHAFDFFCSARMQTDAKPSLAPSYRILFENVDKAVDKGCYPNPLPMHLKCLAISGLPVDEIPCVEVWDMHGQVFNSHQGWKQTNKCTWSSEYGDGFFRVSHDILGDFSVMVRFGGHHALTRDKTTLIFKYQNSTAFLPPEVVELKRQNVDVNPEYADSLDVELFTVHLMFEKAVGSDGASGEGATGGNSARSGCLPMYHLQGRDAFETGLDEISKQHAVVPDPIKSAALANMGFQEHYTTIALQLANNSMDLAAEFIANIKARAAELDASTMSAGGGEAVKYDTSGVEGHDEAKQMSSSLNTPKRSASEASLAYTGISHSVVSSSFTSGASGDTSNLGVNSLASGNEGEIQGFLPKTPSNDPGDEGETWKESKKSVIASAAAAAARIAIANATPPSSPHPAPLCPTCSEDNILKRDQLVPCVSCRKMYHTGCFGARRIPFTLKTPKERQNRDKYVTKHYGQWQCAECVSNKVPIGSPFPVGGTGSEALTPTLSSSSSSSSGGGGLGRLFGTISDDSGAVKHANSTGDLPSQAQSPAPLNIPPNSSYATSSDALWSPEFRPSGGIAFSQGHSPSSPQQKNKTSHDQAAMLMGLLASTGITLDALMSMGEDKQREALVAAATLKNSEGSGNSPNPKMSNASFGSTFGGESNGGGDRTAAGGGGGSGGGGGGGGGTSGSRSSPEKSNDGSGAAAVQSSEESAFSDNTDGSSGGTAAAESASKRNEEAKDVSLPNKAEAIAATTATATTATASNTTATSEAAVSKTSAREAMMAMLANRQKANEGPPPPAIPVEASAPEAPSYTGPKLRDDPLYAKYVKMVKVGLPLSSVASKMVAEQVCPTYEHAAAILTMNPDGPPPDPSNKELSSLPKAEVASTENASVTEVTSAAPGAAETKAEGGGETVPVSEHPNYVKYFKMLKVGLPKDAVKAKMQQEGANPAYLDKDPTELVPLNDKAPYSTTVPVSEHPSYSKYFRMLQVGLPKEAIKIKMQQEGVIPAYLDKDPTEQVPLVVESAKVAVSEHPTYSKYFRMLKVGLPKDAVKAKMTQEGANPAYLDKEPDELVLVEEVKAGAAASIKVEKGPRKKKLHWKGLDASKVGRDSLWADKDDADIVVDEAEFNQLFVESEKPVVKKEEEKEKEGRKKRINLIDNKRGQNGGIALARIRFSFAEVKEKIAGMMDENFSTDQLRSLEEFLPSVEEAYLIRAFKGDRDMLGQAEKYMLEMLGFESAAKRIQCMIYKQQFKGRISECTQIVTKIEAACDDVKMSLRLKKVLKTILKVGNQMNDGADHLGFTLDSLLKLQSAKAFDKKTSILQYVIMLVQRNDENCLLFPDDLAHVAEASRLVLDSVQGERAALRQGLDGACRIVAELRSEDQAKELPNSTGTMSSFLLKARQTCDELDSLIENVKTKYVNVLSYFGEEPSLASHDFFSTLSKFISEFVACRDVLERQRKAEAKRTQRIQAEAVMSALPTRRATTFVPSTSGIGSSSAIAAMLGGGGASGGGDGDGGGKEKAPAPPPAAQDKPTSPKPSRRQSTAY